MASVQDIGQCLQIVHVDILYFILLTHILFIMWLKIEVFSVSSDKFSFETPDPDRFPLAPPFLDRESFEYEKHLLF